MVPSLEPFAPKSNPLKWLLPCSENKALVLNRARTQQQLPVGLTGGRGEIGGHAEHGGSGGRMGAVQLRKAQVVTDRHAETQTQCVAGHRPIARVCGGRFTVLVAVHGHVKQVDLPIHGEVVAIRADKHACVEGA